MQADERPRRSRDPEQSGSCLPEGQLFPSNDSNAGRRIRSGGYLKSITTVSKQRPRRCRVGVADLPDSLADDNRQAVFPSLDTRIGP
jgi:hypothetical protein